MDKPMVALPAIKKMLWIFPRALCFLFCLAIFFSEAAFAQIKTIASKDQFRDALAADGLNVGADFWLRVPLQRHKVYYTSTVPGLSKLTLLDVELLPEDERSTSSMLVLVIRVRTDDNKEESLILNRSVYYFTGVGSPTQLYLYLEDPRKKEIKGWSKKALDAISRGTYFVGMTEQQVWASRGYSKDSRTTVVAGATTKLSIYGEYPNTEYLYYRNGRLVGWQQ
jgi:hypothetical protein